MQYRKFGKHDIQVSALGFGCMRLPVLNGKQEEIDKEKAKTMVRYAIDHGVNYIDTAYPYHKGFSEFFVGEALKDGYREKVYLATKSPVWLIESFEDFDKYLNEQLEKLGTDHIDMYLLHALDKERWEKLKSLDVFKFIDSSLKSGKIKYIGFSFHDELAVFKDIVDSYPWDFCQIQYNYMDEQYQAGQEGLEYAAARNIAVIIMEPLKGGQLSKTPPQAIQDHLKSADIERTPSEWALKWIWNRPEVSVILSGMGAMEQVIENIRTADTSLPNSLTNKEISIVDNVKKAYKSLTKVNCTGCGYCMPCPSSVAIPRNFELYNDRFIYDDLEKYAFTYHSFMPEENRASSCIQCGKCEKACPQNIPIRDMLKVVHKEFTK